MRVFSVHLVFGQEKHIPLYSDHTCIQKYLKKKKKVYTCFIDFRKAFDTVCREALLFKLHQLGVSGRLFACMKYMYSHSQAKIKLFNKISDAMDVLIGTEQGHPMSPELFKCYLLDLSADLDSITDDNIPELNGVLLSHLLWADDLVLLALDGATLQRLIDIVNRYCTQWGLTVNISKTAVLIFNKSGRQLKDSFNFNFGDISIPSAKDYCYLGITFTLSNSLSKTKDELRKKGLRAYFSLRKLIDLKSISVRAVFKLFDSLIVPVIGYGCSVWLHSTNLFKLIANNKLLDDTKHSLRKISLDPVERLHLKLLKWTASVQTKASNLATWGDSGRTPVVVQLIKQTVDYAKRLKFLDQSNSNTLVRHAYVEQKANMLPWYVDTKNLLDYTEDSDTSTSVNIRFKCRELFEDLWRKAKRNSSKMSFYDIIKTAISYEPYLSLNNINNRKAVAKLRFSNHRLNVETGRYIKNKSDTDIDRILWKKCCKSCSDSNAEFLISLPYADPIIEDDHHVLVACPRYHHIRHSLSDNLKSALLSWDPERLRELFNTANIQSFASYVQKILQTQQSRQTTI